MDLFAIKQELSAGKSIYDLALRVTYYARVSTDKDEQAHSLGAQVDYYESFIRSIPGWSFVGGYVDEGVSGTSAARREAFQRMIRDAGQRKFDFIITKEISRFSRNTLDSIGYTQELLRHGVGVFFQSDNINTLMPDAELRLTIMSSIAQDEVRKTSERVRFGFRRSIEKGVVLGNSRIWGYRKDQGRLVIEEEEAEMVRQIFDLYANAGLGVRRICERLTASGHRNRGGNPLSFTTVRNILANPKYKGYYCGGKSTKIDYRLNERKHLDESQWVQYKDELAVPPIVPEELWERANCILRQRGEALKGEEKTGYNNKYAYSGKLVCAEHGAPFYRAVYRYQSGDKEVWQCKRFTERGKAGCGAPAVYTEELDQILRECYHSIFPQKEHLIRRLEQVYAEAAGGGETESAAAKAEAAIGELNGKKDKLLDLAVDGRLSNEEFERRNDALNREIALLREQRRELAEQLEKNRELAHAGDALRERIAQELELFSGFNRQTVDALLERAEVHGAGDKQQAQLTLYFKVRAGAERYLVMRRRGKASVCTRQYI